MKKWITENLKLVALVAGMSLACVGVVSGFNFGTVGFKPSYTQSIPAKSLDVAQKRFSSHYAKFCPPLTNSSTCQNSLTLSVSADNDRAGMLVYDKGELLIDGAPVGSGGSGTFSNSTTAVYGATKTLPAAAANKMFSFRNQTTAVTLIPSSGTQSIYLADGTTPGAGYGIDCVGDGQVLLTAYDALSWWVLTEAGMTCTGGDLALVASLAWSPTSKAYGNITVGQNATQSFTLTNSGTGQASGLSVSVSGATFSIYSSTCGSTLAASANCTVGVRYTPDAADADSGTLTAAATGLSDTTASLSGTGVAGSIPNPDYGWACNDNAANTTVLAQYGGINGTLVNSGNTSAVQTGEGFDLPDTGFVSALVPDTIAEDGDFTVQMDLKYTEPTDDYAYIFSTTASNQFTAILRNSGVIQIYLNGTQITNTDVSARALKDGNWHTVRFVYNGTTLTFYEGPNETSLTQVTQNAGSTPTAWGSTSRFAGAGSTASWKGLVRNIKMWDLAVTP